MKYQTGEIIRIGDSVLIENGKTEGVVEAILNSNIDFKNWGLNHDEPTLILKSEPFGTVAWQVKGADPIIFVARSLHNNE